jgi:hypothetical protein
MSKGQRGNKEAKKPKKVHSPSPPQSNVPVAPSRGLVVPDHLKRR